MTDRLKKQQLKKKIKDRSLNFKTSCPAYIGTTTNFHVKIANGFYILPKNLILLLFPKYNTHTQRYNLIV